MNPLFPFLVIAALAAGQQVTSTDTSTEIKARYLRLGTNPPATECTFTLRLTNAGWSIDSVTGRGKTQLTVASSNDDRGFLGAATATLLADDQKKMVRVEAREGKAKVLRAGQAAQELEAPKGVIVTSAPDWTDTFLLCRRFDRKKGGKQEFPGLWIHPEQPAQNLTFTIERQGADAIDHEGKKIDLDRFLIRIRNNSPYAAWANEAGTMIKLVSLPFQEGKSVELVLEGYEKSAGKLNAKE